MTDRPHPRAGVLGQPIGHSLSPLLHGYWLRTLGLPGSYLAVEVEPAQFAEEVRRLFEDEGWCGMNVTVPHKTAAFDLCERHDAAARRLRAVNFISRTADGLYHGRNTDLTGFRANLENAPAWPGVKRGAAMVLGAGGASGAVVGALLELGFAPIRVANRTQEKADALCHLLRDSDTHGALEAWPLERASAGLADCALLVNATSLGLGGGPGPPLDWAALPVTALVTDLVYNPLETQFLATARRRGNPVLDGLGMLIYQAVPPFCTFFSPPTSLPVDDELRQLLIYAMGSGRPPRDSGDWAG